MWDLLLNEDEAMIADSVREFLALELPLERLRPKATPLDLAQVRKGMAELGWFGVGLPETVGGSGLSLVEEMLIQRECGRHLASPSVLATVLAGHVAVAAGDETLAAALASGEATAALTILRANAAPAGRTPVFAVDAGPGDLLLAWTDQGMGLFDAESLAEAQPHDCLDNSVTLQAGLLALDRPRLWVAAEQAPLALRAQVLLAAALSGLAQQACETTVEYAKVREQFGKPIGSFQAVKHRCANMYVDAELAWYQTSFAGLKVRTGAADAPLQAAAAKLAAAHAARENGRAGIQMHGGIGFHAECDAHWFMKRAHLLDRAGGDMQAQARLVAAEPSPLW